MLFLYCVTFLCILVLPTRFFGSFSYTCSWFLNTSAFSFVILLPPLGVLLFCCLFIVTGLTPFDLATHRRNWENSDWAESLSQISRGGIVLVRSQRRPTKHKQKYLHFSIHFRTFQYILFNTLSIFFTSMTHFWIICFFIFAKKFCPGTVTTVSAPKD